mmetsp:Transcript_31893/g.72335  ORF Transcript_31893/g.72335 Transcript_31893/m.72335 type:complete len:258 (-) Transcript_31893:19-792(-)
MGNGPRRAPGVGLLLQGGARMRDRLLHGLLCRGQSVPRPRLRLHLCVWADLPGPRARTAQLELQLRCVQRVHVRRRLRAHQRPIPGGHKRHARIPGWALVLDDPAVAQAVVPRRHDRPVAAYRGRQISWARSRLRYDDQYHQRRPRVQHGHQLEGHRQGGVFQALRQPLERCRGPGHPLLRPDAELPVRCASAKSGYSTLQNACPSGPLSGSCCPPPVRSGRPRQRRRALSRMPRSAALDAPGVYPLAIRAETRTPQ